jgi:hypothetical protein
MGLNSVKVRATSVQVEHEVTLKDFTKWAGQDGRVTARDDSAQSNQDDSRNAAMMLFEETLIEVWRQVFAESARAVELDGQRYPILRTSKRRLRQVDFKFDGREIRGLEQNPETKSRWAAMARDGKKVMQFLVEGRYVAVVVDGQVKLYGRSGGKS